VDLVDREPGDEHRHHYGLAGAGRHLQCDARQPVVVKVVLGLEPSPIIGGAMTTGDLGQKDRGLDRLALAEQHGLVADGPVRQELARVGRGAVPVVRPPSLDLAPDVVDERVRFATLAGHVEVKRERLVRGLACLLAHRDRDEGLARPATWENRARRTVVAELEVRPRRLVR